MEIVQKKIVNRQFFSSTCCTKNFMNTDIQMIV